MVPRSHTRNRYVLATGWDDQCLAQNQNLDRIFSERRFRTSFYIWDRKLARLAHLAAHDENICKAGNRECETEQGNSAVDG